MPFISIVKVGKIESWPAFSKMVSFTKMQLAFTDFPDFSLLDFSFPDFSFFGSAFEKPLPLFCGGELFLDLSEFLDSTLSGQRKEK